MRRPTATALLLGASALARAVAVGLLGAEQPLDGASAALLVDVLVPAAIANADVRGRPAAATAAVVHGSLAGATLMVNGLAALAGDVALTAPLLVFLGAAVASMLAGATAIGRWQDRGAPLGDAGPRWVRVVALVGAGALAAVLVTTDVAVAGMVPVGDTALPGPVAVATTISLRRVPLLVGALLPMAWVATRTGPAHLRAAALVLGARAVLEVAADASTLPLGAPLWPSAVGATAAALLLVVVPAQVTSSRA